MDQIFTCKKNEIVRELEEITEDLFLKNLEMGKLFLYMSQDSETLKEKIDKQLCVKRRLINNYVYQYQTTDRHLEK